MYYENTMHCFCAACVTSVSVSQSYTLVVSQIYHSRVLIKLAQHDDLTVQIMNNNLFITYFAYWSQANDTFH